MNRETLIKDAAGFISDHLNQTLTENIAREDLKSLGLDSFRIIELVLFLERRSGLQFPEKGYTPANLKSIETIVHRLLAEN